MSKFSRRRSFKGIAAIALLSFGMPDAHAHARLVRSTPKNEAELSTLPRALDFWFNELLDDSFNTVDLYRSDSKERKNLIADKPRVDPKDRTHLTVKLPSLEPGSYVVEYRVLSRDGHTAPGRLTFSVRPNPRP